MMPPNPKFFHPLLLFLLLAMTFTSSSSSSCDSCTSLNLLGSAHFRYPITIISLTQEEVNCTNNPSSSSVGRALYSEPVMFLDSSSNSILSFSTRFTFTIVPSPPPCLAGDGLAFLITSDPNNLPHSDGYMGLPETRGQDSSFLAVEFDTHLDPGLGDINDNHIGIDLDSVHSVASIDLTPKSIDLKSGKRMTAWIEYSDPDKVMQVWLGYTQEKPQSPILKAHIDYKFNKKFMYVGLSASNGRGASAHLIHDWTFKISVLGPNPPSLTSKSNEERMDFHDL